MEQRGAERALRRLVAGLAGASAEDIEAVLDELSADHRRTVQNLLDAYQGVTPSPAPDRARSKGHAIDITGFSAAIARRLELSSGPGAALIVDEHVNWRITETASKALRACALDMAPASVASPPPAQQPWLDRMLRRRSANGQRR